MARPRRELDLKRAVEAIARTDPVALSMDAVARELRLAKPTLYRLAGSREELVALCVDAEAERLLDRVHAAFAGAPAGDPGDRALAAMRAFAADSPAGFELLFGRRHPQARGAIRRLENRLADLLRRSGDAGDEPVSRAAALIGAAAGVVARERHPG
jgi:AcrR family transcriptional regulator